MIPCQVKGEHRRGKRDAARSKSSIILWNFICHFPKLPGFALWHVSKLWASTFAPLLYIIIVKADEKTRRSVSARTFFFFSFYVLFAGKTHAVMRESSRNGTCGCFLTRVEIAVFFCFRKNSKMKMDPYFLSASATFSKNSKSGGGG